MGKGTTKEYEHTGKEGKNKRHKTREEKRKKKVVNGADSNVVRIFMLVGVFLLAYGIFQGHFIAIVLGAASITSSFMVLYLDKIRAFMGRKS